MSSAAASGWRRSARASNRIRQLDMIAVFRPLCFTGKAFLICIAINQPTLDLLPLRLLSIPSCVFPRVCFSLVRERFPSPRKTTKKTSSRRVETCGGYLPYFGFTVSTSQASSCPPQPFRSGIRIRGGVSASWPSLVSTQSKVYAISPYHRPLLSRIHAACRGTSVRE